MRVHTEAQKARAVIRKREYYEKNKPHLLERQKEYAKANRTMVRKSQADWRARNKEQIRAASRRATLKRYGAIDYDAMLAKQGGLCAICRKPETSTLRGKLIPLAVDHDHASGRVRGLLCGKCNKGIGLLGDSASGIRAALAYLEAQ